MLRRRLDASFSIVEPGVAGFLRALVLPVFDAAWVERISRRDPAESPHEHEIQVHESTLRILSRSGEFSREDYLFGSLTALLHDLGEIQRVTELDVREARERGDFAEAERLAARRARQRPLHMIASSELAHELLSRPEFGIPPAVRDRVAEHAGLHDMVKLGVPYPPRSDWAAVCCVEADMLWPVSPEGPAADLRRRGIADPALAQLAAQAHANFETQLVFYRASFPRHERFSDSETFLRTAEGAAILAESRDYWGF